MQLSRAMLLSRHYAAAGITLMAVGWGGTSVEEPLLVESAILKNRSGTMTIEMRFDNKRKRQRK